MSITATPITTTTSTSSPAATSTDSSDSSSGGSNNGASFYRNLFYILIGLLIAFGFVSLVSIWRARRRRAAIVREAQRLGVLVPGVPGYVPVRDRRDFMWTKSDGSTLPDWWEVAGEGEKGVLDSSTVEGDRDAQLRELIPIALIPPQEHDSTSPPPHSDLPFFPNHLAYRPSQLTPQANRYNRDEEALGELRGEDVEVVVMLRMPVEPTPESQNRQPRPDGAEDDEGVMREYEGIHLGIARLGVE